MPTLLSFTVVLTLVAHYAIEMGMLEMAAADQIPSTVLLTWLRPDLRKVLIVSRCDIRDFSSGHIPQQCLFTCLFQHL
jgi:hypothetical protein